MQQIKKMQNYKGIRKFFIIRGNERNKDIIYRHKYKFIKKKKMFFLENEISDILHFRFCINIIPLLIPISQFICNM